MAVLVPGPCRDTRSLRFLPVFHGALQRVHPLHDPLQPIQIDPGLGTISWRLFTGSSVQHEQIEVPSCKAHPLDPRELLEHVGPDRHTAMAAPNRMGNLRHVDVAAGVGTNSMGGDEVP
jgi:hypothetical protein